MTPASSSSASSAPTAQLLTIPSEMKEVESTVLKECVNAINVFSTSRVWCEFIFSLLQDVANGINQRLRGGNWNDHPGVMTALLNRVHLRLVVLENHTMDDLIMLSRLLDLENKRRVWAVRVNAAVSTASSAAVTEATAAAVQSQQCQAAAPFS
jgi:hypothetical protein